NEKTTRTAKVKESTATLVNDTTYIDCIEISALLKGGCPDQLDTWIKDGLLIGRKRIDTFCNGLEKDIQAVKNAITYDWTNGLVEGNVNRLKNKKREMYGKGSFELLRRKVCLSQTG